MQQTFSKQLLYSLDALRGFDMFWIMGAEEFFINRLKLQDHPFGMRYRCSFSIRPGMDLLLMT